MVWIVILTIIFIAAYFINKNIKKSKEDENLILLKNLQRDQSNRGGSYKRLHNPTPIQTLGNKKYTLDYDCAYDFEDYPFEIVGEASYQSNIERYAIKKGDRSCFTELKATINREPNNSYDKNACRVDINGSTVGYFPRNNASSWVNLLKKLGINDNAQVVVDAVIVGGGDKDYKYGVRLHIPTRVANAAKYIEEAKS